MTLPSQLLKPLERTWATRKGCRKSEKVIKVAKYEGFRSTAVFKNAQHKGNFAKPDLSLRLRTFLPVASLEN